MDSLHVVGWRYLIEQLALAPLAWKSVRGLAAADPFWEAARLKLSTCNLADVKQTFSKLDRLGPNCQRPIQCPTRHLMQRPEVGGTCASMQVEAPRP